MTLSFPSYDSHIMTEESELEAKIAALSGKINQHKQYQSPSATTGFAPPQHHYIPTYNPRGSPRWSPYGRGGRAGYQSSYKNRTLVLNGNQAPAPPSPSAKLARPDADAAPNLHPRGGAFVFTRGRGKNQLMNQDTFAREQKQIQELQEQSRSAKRLRSYNRETAKLMTALKASPAQNEHIMTIDGIRFQLRGDGSKLFRLPGESDSCATGGGSGGLKALDADAANKESPRRTTIAGVEFHRTKNGNLVRATAVKRLASAVQHKSKTQCAQFTKHGNCPLGPACKFSHDPEKVTMCKTYLHTGDCPSGASCDLSHEPTYHRVPACTHFLRGNCTNAACRYPHIHVSPTAPVCKSFATLGYCARGPQCPDRHVVECPAYSNAGHCADRESGKCPLPHIDRAATLRKAADRQAKIVLGDASDSESSAESEAPGDDDDDADMQDVDSDEAEMIIAGDGDSQSVTLQHDFVPLS